MIGEEIKRLREQEGLTQQELADKAGLKQPTIARYESGRSDISYVSLIKILDTLGYKIKFEKKNE